jgi:glycosyltransferase involved in cell wall biosynthesis
MAENSEICMVLEGTYPYVPGGVSSWLHTVMSSLSEETFSILHIGPYPGAYGEPRYRIPDNVRGMSEVFCNARPGGLPRKAPPKRPRKTIRRHSRVIRALERMHIEGMVDDELIEDLASADLSVESFLHDAESFSLIRDTLYANLAADTPFTDFFWHMRAMHVPLLRLINAELPKSALYHSSSCGYAGMLATIAGVRYGRPVMITEHGIYARERELELSRTTWIRDRGLDGPEGSPVELSPLRKIWTNYFTMLSRIAYHRADKLITLSEVNRARQVADGAHPQAIEIVPNGVELEPYAPCAASPRRTQKDGVLRVGFVGRVVPIKDVLSLIRAVHLAVQSVDLEMWIVGPEDEDLDYAKRCHELVELLGLESTIQFLGRRNVQEIYPEIDLLLLTSISEGQPLVILEAYAAALPVVSTDVGACRELIEGAEGIDADLGPSGIVTRVANPTQTAEALVRLARNRQELQTMGQVGLLRVTQRYQLSAVLDRYRELYRDMLDA